jgi:DNA-binding NtrC family response regulator
MSTRGCILVVDDEAAILENCRRLLAAEGYECRTLQDPLRFPEMLREVKPDLLLLDMCMPEADGMTVLTAAMASEPTLPVIVITAFASIGSAVRAMREGAFDYLPKPFNADQLLLAVERALRYRGLALENAALRAQVSGRGEDMIGSSPQFLRLLEEARKVARTEANVLITGESGAGKEGLARFLHTESPRRNRPFIPVDCAALPETLLESELFGHDRGAFTGAVSRKDGLLTSADGGTAFLDEIAEMSLTLQAKLLRALEDRKIRRVGSVDFVQIDLRIIAATNVDLEDAVEKGSFRQDLYYRLNVVPLRAPPLRERDGDIALLMQAFLRQSAAEMGRDPPQVSPDVWEALERHRWPGNVRELRNLARRLVALDDDGRIKLSDLPESVRDSLPESPAGTPRWLANYGGELPRYEVARELALSEFQAAYVERLLAATGNNITRAARAAGVSRRSFHRWLAELGAEAREVSP